MSLHILSLFELMAQPSEFLNYGQATDRLSALSDSDSLSSPMFFVQASVW